MDNKTREVMIPAQEPVRNLRTRAPATKLRIFSARFVVSDRIIAAATHGRRKLRHFSMRLFDVNSVRQIARQATEFERKR